MTIAACYLSPEGVVLGPDSAATFGPTNHFMHEQKIFEIGKRGESRLGLVMWGLAAFDEISYRTLIARFSDTVAEDSGVSIELLAQRWSEMFWGTYTSQFANLIELFKELSQPGDTSADLDEQRDELAHAMSGGFCLGGYALPGRTPEAYAITYSIQQDAPNIDKLAMGKPRFWGQPNMLQRLSMGIAIDTYMGILDARDQDGQLRWHGTSEDLIQIIEENRLGIPSRHLPIREAIDWVHSSIYTTIKAMKFANLPPVCGGPIEVAVITSDRHFRWVRHKELDTAIGYHPSQRESR